MRPVSLGVMVLQTIEGTYENGAIRLDGEAPPVQRAKVLVTFLGASGSIDLAPLGIQPAQAAELRARLASFAEEWNQPEMDVYDDYDAARPTV